MGQAYWIIEYIKVLLAYCFMIYVWPMVIFHRHLKGRSKTYTFAFCVTVSVLIINTGVLMIGLVHLLKPSLCFVLYWSVFFVQFFRLCKPRFRWVQDLRRLAAGTIGRRQLFHRWSVAIAERLQGIAKKLAAMTKNHRLELLLLSVILVFGTIYFSWGAFDTHAYGASDQYVHNQWIYSLKEGKIFSAGIYPAAMHCMIYLLSVVFHIRTFSCILFLGGVYLHVILISAYLFMREIFHWRYTPMIALLLFLCLDQVNTYAVFSVSRLGWTLPMEYGMFTQYLSAGFLLRFFKRVTGGYRLKVNWLKPREWVKIFRDEDILIFMMSVASSIAIHFYCTILAFFFCAGVCVVFLKKLFTLGSFGPVVVAAFTALFIAVFPMGAAYAAGYPLQGSLYWAIGIINESPEDTASDDELDQDVSFEPEESTADSGTENEGNPSDDSAQNGAIPNGGDNSYVPPEVVPKPSILTKIARACGIILADSYENIYSQVRSRLILAATSFAVLVGCVKHLFSLLRYWKEKKKYNAVTLHTKVEEQIFANAKTAVISCDGYLVAAATSLILMTMCCAGSLGIPRLLEMERLYTSCQMVNVMLYAILADVVFAILGSFFPVFPLQLASVAALIGVYLFIQQAGLFHGYLIYHFTRYQAAVDMTEKIITTIPKEHYTIISNTEELYQVIETGYHEELLLFIQRENVQNYTLPTPYLFLFIEKKPLRYAHYHFASGPRWLAWEKYVDLFPSLGSQCPDVLHTEIDEESADGDLIYGAKLSDSATDLTGRKVLESKAYRWFLTFSNYYPYEGQVVYEDDDFLCYCIVQNVNCLFSLGVMSDNYIPWQTPRELANHTSVNGFSHGLTK